MPLSALSSCFRCFTDTSASSDTPSGIASSTNSMVTFTSPFGSASSPSDRKQISYARNPSRDFPSASDASVVSAAAFSSSAGNAFASDAASVPFPRSSVSFCSVNSYCALIASISASSSSVFSAVNSFVISVYTIGVTDSSAPFGMTPAPAVTWIITLLSSSSHISSYACSCWISQASAYRSQLPAGTSAVPPPSTVPSASVSSDTLSSVTENMASVAFSASPSSSSGAVYSIVIAACPLRSAASPVSSYVKEISYARMPATSIPGFASQISSAAFSVAAGAAYISIPLRSTSSRAVAATRKPSPS